MSEESKDTGNQEKFISVKTNEPIFRQVLSDVKERFSDFVPNSFDPNGNIDSIIETYFDSPVASRGFGIGEFEVGPETSFSEQEVYTKLHSKPLKENEAVIEIHNFGNLSGRNYILGYEINDDGDVVFKGEIPGTTMRR